MLVVFADKGIEGDLCVSIVRELEAQLEEEKKERKAALPFNPHSSLAGWIRHFFHSPIQRVGLSRDLV